MRLAIVDSHNQPINPEYTPNARMAIVGIPYLSLICVNQSALFRGYCEINS